MGTFEKIIRTGLGAALITEKEARSYLSRQARRSKEELTNIVAREMARFLQRIDLKTEIRKALEGLTIEIRIKRPRN